MIAETEHKKAIVVGASSGIGRALAKVLAANGYEVGLASRRIELLSQLQTEIPARTYIKNIDVSKPDQAMFLLQDLIHEMGAVDLIVLNSGINDSNANLDWKGEINTVEVNVVGFLACANVAVKHFIRQKSGHLVGISSIAALRGSATTPAYSAAKAFVSNYLEGLRHKLIEHRIYVTDIRPGLVDTPLIKDNPLKFWVATPEGAAGQIFQAISKKKKIVYITKRWTLIAWLLKIMPNWVYHLRFKISRNNPCLKGPTPKGPLPASTDKRSQC